MKLSKRFSLFKKSLGLTLAASCMLAINSCNNVTSVPRPTMTATLSKSLSAPVFPEHTTDDQGNPIVVTYAEKYYTVSQGRKRKVFLSWNKIEIAKYYEIYSAANINDTFVKIGETKNSNFEDSIGSGKTYWYKVRAVNTKGECSDFSSIVKGTSLATPAITDITITDTSATLFWYMGNVGIDTYAKSLVYEIHAYHGSEEKIATIKAWDENNSSVIEQYTFENLAGNVEYTFKVDAYVTSDQSQVESSPKVSQKTLSQYTPVSPEFTASQGESVDYVKLFIKLPPMVQVSIGSGVNSDEKNFPLCFEIQRKRSTETTYRTIVPTLYFDGTTTKPTKEAYDAYTEGAMIEWPDAVGNSSTSVARGVKYDYRIVSIIDTNFSAVNSFGYDSTVKSKEAVANTAQGWAAAHPEFKVKDFKKTINPADDTKVDSVSLGFEASWNDLDKAQEYKFAIRQNRTTATDSTGTDSWITDTNGNVLLGSLEKVAQVTQTYDLAGDAANASGLYRYTLYVVPAKFTDKDKILGNYMDKVEAIDLISVDRNATAPNAEITVEGGWTNKILVTWLPEDEVDYNLLWEKWDIATNGKVDGGTISSDQLKVNGAYTGSYEHAVEEGYEYRYNLKANNTTGNTKTARTLGKPVISFTANSYTEISATWTQAVAAEEYEVKLGSAGTFGNGVIFMVSKDGSAYNVPDGLTVTSSLDAPTGIISLTITKPYGWNNALLSGKAAKLVVTAISALDNQNNPKGKNPAEKDVWTIGPACVDLKATESDEVAKTSVKVTWKALDGAKGYAVYRLRPAMVTGKDASGNATSNEPSLDVYYVKADGTKTNGNINVTLADGTFTLTDIYSKAAGNGAYDKNQQYLALGIPYTYTVLPLLSEENKNPDDVDNPSQWKIPNTDLTTYTTDTYANIASAEKIGYTTGYGLAVEATKAEYSDKVILTWERPQSAIDKNKIPTIWYRKKGSNDAWIPAINMGSNIITDNTVDTLNLTPANYSGTAYDDTIQALEYAVTYTAGMDISNASGEDAAYVEYLSGLKNVKITDAEKMNVGYMFSLPTIASAPITAANESYTETFNWYLYDHDNNRAVGNDISSYAVDLTNLNITDYDPGKQKGWPLYTYDYDKTEGGVRKYKANKITAYNWYDAAIEFKPNDDTITMSLTPGSINQTNNTGTHNGILKVQRDYIHTYTVSATRTNSQGESITTSTKAGLYRKITTDEFAKCVTLIIADSIYQLGAVKTGPKNKTLNGADGSYFARMTYNLATFYQYYYVYTDYRANFGKLPGQNSRFASDFILNCEEGPFGATADDSIIGLGTNTITVSHKTQLKSYQGTVTIGCGNCDPKNFFGWPKDWNLTLSYANGYANSSHNISKNESEFKKWFPFSLLQHLNDGITDGTDSSYPTMNGTWWEVHNK